MSRYNDAPADRRLPDELVESLVEIRHDLHAHPEVGYEEHRTSEVIQRELTAAGIEHVGGLA
ncbi:MAG: N-acyl-L-amino acid amidohydrolase, partial [Phycisphaerae bacterium]|nr:N-acyl-L-amino acid amidohydrolase [Phycisphaerae bacterium]